MQLLVDGMNTALGEMANIHSTITNLSHQKVMCTLVSYKGYQFHAKLFSK